MPVYRGSWYSQLPPFGWFDREDKPGSNALGVPDAQQGIALPNRGTLGQWYNVTPPGGNLPFPMQQTDVGPAKWTGRGVDISAAAAHQMGYTPKDFPTDAGWKVEPRDEPRGLGSPAGMPVQAGDLPDNATGGDAIASGPPQQQGRKMPNSLMDMFQPRDMGGQPTGFGDMLAQRQNSLVGLGLGLMAGSAQDPYGRAMTGYAQGANSDQDRYQAAQRLAEARASREQAQANADRAFNREPEVLRTMRAVGIDPSSPEGRALLYPKTDEWKEGKVTHREQDYPYRANLRTGQYEWGPMGPPPGLNARPGAPAVTSPYAGGAAVPFVGGGGIPSSSGEFPPAAGSTPIAGTLPTGILPPPLPGIEQELPSVQKAARLKQVEEAAKHATKDPQQEAAAKQAAGNVLTALDTAEKLAGNQGGFLPTTGIVGGALQHVYQPAKDLATTLDTVKANVSLDKLTAMRAASTTGASGLGAVTEGEHKLLQASIAALDQSQSPEQFKANLKRVRATYEWIVNRTDANQPPPFSLRPDASQPTTAGGTGATGGRTFIRDPSGRIVPQ